MRLRLSFLILLLYTCWTPTRSYAQETLDTVLLPAPTMLARYDGTPNFSVPAPRASLDIDALPTYESESLLSVVNRVAGVRLEQRATASYRVAIRGASLRAPFGVRNVQVFWNGIPFGEPGGDVPLNFLDASNVDRVSILRGPNGGLFGPGTAGTIFLRTEPTRVDSVTRVRVSASAGSYGFARTDLRLTRPNRFGGADEIRAGYQRTDGYREHSAMDRFTAQYTSQLGKATRLHALYTDLSYELPGGLNAEQFAENPRQARPGSVDKNASINYHNLLLGLTTEKRIGKVRSTTAAYATGFYFDHPFNFDYKRETNLGAGVRSVLGYVRGYWALNAGAMVRTQQRSGQNFQNTAGRPGDLNFADEIRSADALAFVDGRYAPGNWDFQANLTTSALRYDVDRTFDADGNTGLTEFRTTRPVSLRLSAGRRFGNFRHFVYAARADGFSPPTLDEFRTNEGSLNVGLAPEIGTNYEIGYRYAHRRLRLEAIAFYFNLDEAITTFTDERGTQLFRNAGRTRQAGVELTAEQERLGRFMGGNLAALATYTYYNFTYRDLTRGGTDLSGQTIPGAAPHTVNLELNWQHPRGLYANFLHNFTDATPLNDANDVIADSFHNLRGNIGYRWKKYDVYVSGNNLLDDELNLGYDLNVRFGARYFQPAPGRTWLVGIIVK